VEELLQHADEALYRAKNKGRNRVEAVRAAGILPQRAGLQVKRVGARD
jgi:hypothetical protein